MSPAANRVLTVVAALVLAWALGLPWYAPSGTDPTSTDGPVEQFAWHLARVFQDVSRVRAGDVAIPGGPTALLVAVGVAALLAVLLLVVSAAWVGDLLRLVALVPLGLVLVAAVVQPDGFALHYGIVLAAAAALVLVSAAWQAAEVRRKTAPAFR